MVFILVVVFIIIIIIITGLLRCFCMHTVCQTQKGNLILAMRVAQYLASVLFLFQRCC